MVINYSLGVNVIKQRITEDKPIEEEEKSDRLAMSMPANMMNKYIDESPLRKREGTADEEHLCVICFDKAI